MLITTVRTLRPMLTFFLRLSFFFRWKARNAGQIKEAMSRLFPASNKRKNQNSEQKKKKENEKPNKRYYAARAAPMYVCVHLPKLFFFV